MDIPQVLYWVKNNCSACYGIRPAQGAYAREENAAYENLKYKSGYHITD